MTGGWAGGPATAPYPDRPGLSQMPVGQPADPVATPAEVRERHKSKSTQRKSPGRPSTCDRCMWAEHGCCPDHLNSYETVNPLAGVVGPSSRPVQLPAWLRGSQWEAD